MKIYVSVDLEGLPGISTLSQVAPGYPLYGDARRIMTWIVNVLADEFSVLGVDDVVVADSHGFMANIDYIDVDERVRLVQGYPRPFSMVLGVEEGFDAAMFIGYHAAAGTTGGFLEHTYSSRVIHRIYVNGELASEYLLNALYAGEHGVPVVLVAGDEHLRSQVEKHTPWAVFLPLKKGYGRLAAMYESKSLVEQKLRKAVREAVERLKRGKAQPLKPNGELELRVELRDSLYADMAQLLPRAERLDAYTLRYRAYSARDALAFVELVAWIGYAASAMMEKMRG
ncbi:M55 family metallopeptidase [Hyperthermus butylicus]|uniref:D-aminopeptidase n=1 Tax=Hyperthermus butylicus (strain DSM 5456 / JCM 9403 / PLM1-5) TaxID=415426 RepID=A2BMJ8_HYPBU|nr:M55 family metallopeptidase [Hyperthermus butylicus]ABM81209.1 D-aminopeptidase [Hyperthermus butylicus DSM 5456]